MTADFGCLRGVWWYGGGGGWWWWWWRVFMCVCVCVREGWIEGGWGVGAACESIS